MTNTTETRTIDAGDWIELAGLRTGKVAWVEGDELFALMDDGDGRPEAIAVGQVVRVMPAR